MDAVPVSEFPGRLYSDAGEPGLFLRSAVVEGKVKADVLLTHGFGEHSAKYAHVARFFAQHGYRLCGYDMRGHGHSPGQRGDIDRYETLLDDLDVVRKIHGLHDREEAPIFLYGHSFGGQVTLNYILQRRPAAVQGVIVSSPLVKLAFQPSRLKVLLANLMIKVWPSFTQGGPNDKSALTRDVAFLDSLPEPELLHHRVSARMYREILAGAASLREGASRFTLPLLVIQGSDDAIVSAPAAQAFYEAAGSADKTMRMHPGMRHETQNETGRETVLAEMVEWMDRHLPA